MAFVSVIVGLLPWLIRLMVFGMGMNIRNPDFRYLLNNPLKLVKGFAALYVLIPLLAFFVGSILPVTPVVRVLLVLLALSAGAPALPKRLLKAGSDKAYVYSLMLYTSIISVLIIPALAPYFKSIGLIEVEAQVTAWEVAGVLADSFVVPLLLGMLAARLWPRLAERVADPIISVSSIGVALIGLVLVAAFAPMLGKVSPMDYVAIVIFAAGAMLLGYGFGGPKSDDRFSLGMAGAVRHSGLALILAVRFFPKSALLPALLVYLLVVQVVAVLFKKFTPESAEQD